MTTQSEIRFIWDRLLKHKAMLITIAISGILYGVSKALVSHYVKQLMDSATVPENINSLAGAGVALALLISISRSFHIFTMNMVTEKVTKDIRQQLQQKFLRLNLKFHTNYAAGSGGLLSRTFNDVKIIQDGLRLFADLFTAPIMFIAVVFNLFFFDAKLAVSIIVITPVILFFLKQLSKTIKKYSIFGVEQFERITSTIKESLDGVRTIQAFNLEHLFKLKLEKQNDELIDMRRKVYSRVELIGPINEFVATLILVAIFYYFSTKIASGQSSYGVLMAYLTTIMQANEPIKKFQEAIVRLQETRVSADRVQKMLVEQSEVPESKLNLPFPHKWSKIQYKNVSFSYLSDSSTQKPFIENFNLTITKGQTIAFVGESGSGKTTLANLLARFYDPQSGNILIDETSIQDINLNLLRKNIGLVSQDVFLFNDTVTANITAGSAFDPMNESDIHRLHESARAAFADHFINLLEHQYNTVLNEKGSNFSGGEKQRLAIARALYKDAPILILDEATSALDSVSEVQVQKGLEILMKGRTTFVIAHRLSTIQNADLILVLQKGQIAEIGHHHDLLAKSGVYKQLYETQYRH